MAGLLEKKFEGLVDQVCGFFEAKGSETSIVREWDVRKGQRANRYSAFVRPEWSAARVEVTDPWFPKVARHQFASVIAEELGLVEPADGLLLRC